MSRLSLTVAALCLFVMAPAATAAQFVNHGGYRIHYTTFPSTLIPPDVASVHGITRAENQVVLNISVRKGDEPVGVELNGSVTNLLNQMTSLDFSEVNEQDAIYYLAHHTAIEKDILRFSITLTFDDDAVLPYQLEFVRNYF